MTTDIIERLAKEKAAGGRECALFATGLFQEAMLILMHFLNLFHFK